MPNETKWSAGPWTVSPPDRKAEGSKLYVRCARRIDGAPAGIAVAHVLAAPGIDEQRANAQLIGSVCHLADALLVMVLDKRISAWLREHDPKALQQAEAALLAAGYPLQADGEARHA
jgi:hypothetical protein